MDQTILEAGKWNLCLGETRILFCWRTERKQEKPEVGGTSKIGMVVGAGMLHKGDSEEVPAQSSSHLAKAKSCRQLSRAPHIASQEPWNKPVVLHAGIASRSTESELTHWSPSGCQPLTLVQRLVWKAFQSPSAPSQTSRGA